MKYLIEQLDTDEGNLSLLLREGYTVLTSYKLAVQRLLAELFSARITKSDSIRLERLNNSKLAYPRYCRKSHYTTGI